MPLFVTRAHEAITNGRKTEIRAHTLTRAHQVEQLLEGLDGEKRSELVLDGPDDTFMIVGGGAGRRYVVSIAIHTDEIFFELLRSDAADAQSGAAIRLVTRGQLGVYDANCVVDFATALRAARTFAESGEPDLNLRWKRS